MLTILGMGCGKKQARNILGRKKTIATWEQFEMRGKTDILRKVTVF